MLTELRTTTNVLTSVSMSCELDRLVSTDDKVQEQVADATMRFLDSDWGDVSLQDASENDAWPMLAVGHYGKVVISSIPHMGKRLVTISLLPKGKK